VRLLFLCRSLYHFFKNLNCGKQKDLNRLKHHLFLLFWFPVFILTVSPERINLSTCDIYLRQSFLDVCRTGGSVHYVLAVLQPFPVQEVGVQVPTNVPTPSPCLSLDPTPLGNLREGAQVEQARELRAAIICAVGILLPLSETQESHLLTNMLPAWGFTFLLPVQTVYH
jgi:hypothetical protein